jgi:hypothetical protein
MPIRRGTPSFCGLAPTCEIAGISVIVLFVLQETAVLDARLPGQCFLAVGRPQSFCTAFPTGDLTNALPSASPENSGRGATAANHALSDASVLDALHQDTHVATGCAQRLLEIETRNGRQGRIAEHLNRMDFIVLDELGYLPLAQSGGQLLFHLVSRLYERTSIVVTTNPADAR